MDYKTLIERLEEWNENLISELCADDVLTCDELCGCTKDCIVTQAVTAITELLERAEKAERERDAMRDAAIMQQKYQRLYDTHKLSKKAMCELCVPFRDKYGLTDLQTLRIARKEMDLMEIVELLQPKEE